MTLLGQNINQMKQNSIFGKIYHLIHRLLKNLAASLQRFWCNGVQMHVGFLASAALGGRSISASVEHQARSY